GAFQPGDALAPPFEVVCCAAGGLIVGLNGAVVLTADRGTTWTRRQLPNQGPVKALAASASSPGTLYAIGANWLAQSSDGGSTWQSRTARSPIRSGRLCLGRTPRSWSAATPGQSSD